MGWMEVFSLMKRLLPMLERVAPMLEATLAGRGAARAELGRTSAYTEQLTQMEARLAEELTAQRKQLDELSGDLKALHSVHERIDRVEEELRSTRNLLRFATVAGLLLLLTVVVLAVMLLLRHSS